MSFRMESGPLRRGAWGSASRCRFARLALGMVACLGLFGLIGCGDDAETANDGTEQTADEHDHHESGPHGGHIADLDGGTYHAEWLHNDRTGTVTVYLLDSSAEEEVAIPDPHITITTRIEGGEENTYELLAEPAAAGEDASKFAITDNELLVALKMGEGAEAELSVTIDGETYTGILEHHHGDGHDH